MAFHLIGSLVITVLLSLSTGGVIGLITGGIYTSTNAIITSFKKWFKTYDKILNDKLNDIKHKFIEETTKVRIIYFRLYFDLIKEIKKNFAEIISIIYADLSRKEQQKWIWNDLNREYIILKNNILTKFKIKYQKIFNNKY